MPAIKISPDGTLTFIYSDTLLTLMSEGDSKVARASHVEPAADGGWEADMGPVNGPILRGFATRQAALDAEVQWLRANVLGVTR